MLATRCSWVEYLVYLYGVKLALVAALREQA